MTASAPASPWRRFMCIAYEAVLLFGVLFLFGYAFSALTQFTGAPGTLRNAFQIYLLLLLAAYFVGFWSQGRRTLPMKTMQVRLVDGDGATLRWPRALLRFCVALAIPLAALALASAVHKALALVALVPLAWCVFDRQRRALYDVIAGTRLVHGSGSGATA